MHRIEVDTGRCRDMGLFQHLLGERRDVALVLGPAEVALREEGSYVVALLSRYDAPLGAAADVGVDDAVEARPRRAEADAEGRRGVLRPCQGI